MPEVTQEQMQLLRPYMVGQQPNEKGEVDLHCPLHGDRNRSAQMNVRKGKWYCHAGCGGGDVEGLCDLADTWEPPPHAAAARNGKGKTSARGEAETFTTEQIDAWHAALMSQEPGVDPQLSYLEDVRGLWQPTLARYRIGWDEVRQRFTIPVEDGEGSVSTIRFYQPYPREGRRKIWGLKGRNSPRIFPRQVLTGDPDEVIICEGEWDAILANQFGFPAVTRTSSAKTWKTQWNKLFKGKRVYVCHDMDTAGQEANEYVAEQVAKYAKEVRIIRLPYPVIEDHGKDLTDFFEDHPRNGRSVLRKLMEEAAVYGSEPKPEQADDAPEHVPIDEIVRQENFERRLETEVTIRGVQDDNWWAPKKLTFRCTRDAGDKCAECPMKKKGKMVEEILPTDRRILRVIGREESTVLKQFHNDFARENVPGGKCTKLGYPEITKRQPVSKMVAQQTVDTSLDSYHPDNNLKITAAGDFASFPTNVQARLIGLPTSDPNSNRFEFLIEDMREVAISTDHFEPDPETIERLRRFSPAEDEAPLEKLLALAGAMEAVTGIHGRAEMHAAMDLVWHSSLSFDFRRQRMKRGWLEALIVGDTRTGKSETAQRLAEHYGVGAFVSCESATMAGIKGAVTKMGKGDDKWYISWGALPLNDRRLVILDEVKGLAPEEIADLSDVRSSGVIKLTKARTEQALARTRGIWLSNPRDGDSVNTYYGIDVVLPLIGASEDVARFDLALVVRDDVSMDEINRLIDGRPDYPAADCNALIRWAWSRSPEQVIWEEGAEEFVVLCANKLVRDYVEDPPLIRRGDQRIKLARLAVALAARLFSTDETFERIVVKREHVRDAARFLDRIFSMAQVGYREKSDRLKERAKHAEKSIEQARTFLKRQVKQHGPQLIDYLRGRDEFFNKDLQEFLGMESETANFFTSQLASYGMLQRGRRGANVLTPVFQQLLKEGE